jgi:hypothetical protein
MMIFYSIIESTDTDFDTLQDPANLAQATIQLGQGH